MAASSLAHWLTDSRHPLTSRVFVNRAWHHLFGAGLVATVDNFGTTGETPSHPELLDTLAIEFVEDGWSLKRLVRRLVLSRTWRQASTYDQASFLKDPENRLLWRMPKQRLEAEAIRDAMLAVTDELDVSPAKGSLVAAVIGEPPHLVDRTGQTAPQRPRRLIASFRLSARHPRPIARCARTV
ncbi:MAG: DUF1553 domain-containing protein [Pirellulaceae bacterium]